MGLLAPDWPGAGDNYVDQEGQRQGLGAVSVSVIRMQIKDTLSIQLSFC